VTQARSVPNCGGVRGRRSGWLGELVINHAVDPLDGDDVTVYHVEDPIPVGTETVVPAPVERLRWIRVVSQGSDGHADRAHAVLIAQITAG
jgi:hypothetical protein